jgi:hypothetical protein
VIDVGVASVLIALAVFTRYRPLGPSSLWLDDAWAAVSYKANGPKELWRTTFTSPAFSIGTALWLRAVGFSALRAQLLAFVPGILGPSTLYLVARRMRLGRPAALLAATAILVAPLHMQYSIHVKQYAFEALLSAGILAAGWWLLNAPDRHRWRMWTLVAIVATLCSVAIAPVVAGAYAAGFWAVRRRRKELVHATASLAQYAIAMGAWYVVLIKPESHPALRRYWQHVGGFWTKHDDASVAKGFIATLDHVARGFSSLPAAATIVVLATAMVVCFIRSKERAILLVVPLVVAFALSGLRLAPLGARVDVYLYPTFAILLAYASQPLFERFRAAWILAPLALALLLFVTPLPTAYQREDARPLVLRLEADVKPGDRIVVYPTGRFAFALYTHWPVHIERDHTEALAFTPTIAHRGVAIISADLPLGALLERYRSDPSIRRVWFFGTHGQGRPVEAMSRSIEHAGFMRTRVLGDSSAWLYEFERAP